MRSRNDTGGDSTGIGSSLVMAGLNHCRASGYESVMVLGYPEFYGRFGFSSQLARRVACPFGEGDVWMGCELKSGALANVVGSAIFSPPFFMLEPDSEF